MDQATLQQWLTDAQTALQSLMTGSREEEIRLADGSSVRYSQTNIADLQQYIARLQTMVTPRSPIFFGFGR
jgi:hypothetical protein